MLSRDAGEVTVCDLPGDIRALEAKHLIGLVPQHLALYPNLSGRENLAFFGRLYGLRGDDLKRRLDEVLEIV
jgi:ABC-2 type transport system ATP-binding protein